MEAIRTTVSCLICGDSATVGVTSPPSPETLQKFVEQLGLQGQHWSSVTLCEDCVTGVVKAVEWREEVVEVERDVRSLQRIILKMMRQLTSLRGNYLGEINKLEGKIKRSGETRSGKATCGTIDKGDALRQGILKAVEELGVFQEQEARCATAGAAEQIAPAKTADRNSQIVIMEQQQLLSESAIKTEDDPSIPELEEELGPAGQDHLSTDTIDIEHVIYSQDLVKEEVEDINDDNQAATPVVLTTGSISRSSGWKPRKKKEFKRKAAPIHESERPHKCQFCPMAFKINGHLNRHLLIHSGKKPFTCAQCGVCFSRNDHLEAHNWRHTEEKRFECQDCGQGFSDKRDLNKHRNKRHLHSGNAE